MEKQLSGDAAEVREVILRAHRRGELADADMDWAEDRRSDGVAATEILAEMLERAIERRKRRQVDVDSV